MKKLLLSGLCIGVALLSLYRTDVAAQPAAPNVSTPVKSENLDAVVFAEWEGGTEKVLGGSRDRSLEWVVWSEKNAIGFNGLWFGDSKTPGTRHLRIGFKTPIRVGTVLTRGGGALSVLKADANYPGALNDESQWVPAQRLINGLPSRAEVENTEYGLWVLPPNTQTRALRFSHVAQAADNRYGGWLGAAFVMEDRVTNLAPQALAVAGSNNQKSNLLNNGTYENEGWANDVVEGSSPVSSTRPQSVLLVWPSPVKVSGVLGLWAGFGAAEVQAYVGPTDRHPRDASETDWKSIRTFHGLKNGYPTTLWPNRLDFGQEVTTRAVRLQITAPTDESHPHLSKKTSEGKRVWMGELMALQALDNAPLQEVKFASDASTPHPPIPIRFTLPKPGYVTLVIENKDGVRVRNLVSETYFPAGQNIAWWDGTDDLGRDIDAARHGLYKIPAQFVAPGEYSVRGLIRDAIDLRYEFSVYQEGNPPWHLPDHTGAWLSNHSPPQAALYVPEGKSPTVKAAVLLGSFVSEGTDGIAWVDLEGRKQGGKGWLGGTWTGAPYLARDLGPNADAKTYAYAGTAWQGALRLTALQTDGTDKSVFPQSAWKVVGDTKDDARANKVMSGLAVYNGLLAVSLRQSNELLFVDTKTGQAAGSAKVSDPRGLAFDASGRLFVLSGTKLLRFENASTPAALPAPQTIIASGLEDPQGLALDDKGNIFISDWGQSHQVKVFDATGKLVRAIGKAGAPKAGPYDALHMNHPHGISLDSQNRLWVTENDYLPKRVSVWSLDGKLQRAWYGPSKYGGGGALDPNDKAISYYGEEHHGTLEFALDWEKGVFQVRNVLYRAEDGKVKLATRSAAPETAHYLNGRRYLTNSFNSSPTGGAATAFIFLEKDGVARPVSAAGRANDWDALKGDAFKPFWPKGADLGGDIWQGNARNQVFFIWSDESGDGDVQPNEVLWQQDVAGGITIMPDLSFCASRLGGKATQFAPAGFSAAGAPRYDIAKPKVLAEGVQTPGSSGGDQVLAASDGQTVMTLGVKPFHSHSITGLKNGVPSWSYPNVWPGLHASHEAAKPDRPGQVIGATRLLGGFVKPKGDAGQVWGVNGNMGNMYLFTADGLFVATVFEDVRVGKLWQMPAAQRNMKLENISLHDENFWPTLNETPDGKIYLQDGSKTALVRVDGLDSIRRIAPMPLRVSADDLKKAQEYTVAAEASRQQAQGRGVLEVAIKNAPPVVDGKLDDWAGASWVNIDKSGVGANFNSTSKPYDITATVAVSGDRLYAAWRTGTADLLKNSGEMPVAPFKTGGALDIMLGTNPAADPKRSTPVEGDLRLLITQAKGKTLALIYRAVVPGTTTPVPFSSPWRTITLDKVEDVSTRVQLAGEGGNYEVSIPLSVLGLKPQASQSLRGDIGVLRGDGSQTTARTYWSNKATGITSDVPSEAMLTPNLWGEWRFIK